MKAHLNKMLGMCIVAQPTVQPTSLFQARLKIGGEYDSNDPMDNHANKSRYSQQVGRGIVNMIHHSNIALKGNLVELDVYVLHIHPKMGNHEFCFITLWE